MFDTPSLGPEDAAVLETFVVPRYLSLFGELALQMILVGEGGARIAHLGCRVGYPDRLLVQKIPGATVAGVDSSSPALELARNKGALMGAASLEYVEGNGYPTPLTSEAFSHTLALHPTANAQGRKELFREMRRLMYPGGQALVALPLRGSFQEVVDLVREYALKVDDQDLDRAMEESVFDRPSIESLAEEMESVGLDDVDVEIRQTVLTYANGRVFSEDAASRLLIVPEQKALIGDVDLDKPLAYLRDAIDKYWSEGEFELTVHVGCASAREPI